MTKRQMEQGVRATKSRGTIRFLRFGNAFNTPLVTLVDIPGSLPGANREYRGIIPRGDKLPFPYSESTAPKIS